MNERIYKCKQEEVPAIADMLIASLRKDLNLFTDHSSRFTLAFIDGMVAKSDQCKGLTSSGLLTKEIKSTTTQIGVKAISLGTKLNRLGNYIEQAGSELDVAESDMGIAAVRKSLNKGNYEGLVKNMRSLMQAVSRNMTVLQAKGLKPEFVTELIALNDEIDTLDALQNSKTSERNRLTDANNGVLNEMWEMNQLVLDTGTALFKGVDEVKLKDYTLSVLLSRIHAEGGRDAKTPEVTK
jgi:hypothetical protein